MKLMTRLMGAAVIAASALSSAPLFAEGGTLVIVANQVPRHLNGAVQSGIATAVPSTQIFASPLRYDEDWTPQPCQKLGNVRGRPEPDAEPCAECNLP